LILSELQNLVLWYPGVAIEIEFRRQKTECLKILSNSTIISAQQNLLKLRSVYSEKGFPKYFQKDISNQALPCAHQIDDEIQPVGSKIGPGKHHQSGRALRE